MTFKFYSSLQSGATLLSASVSDNADIYNTAVSIFRQVLVTGYGPQSGAGWTEPYPVGPGGEVFFKSPSTNVDWGIRFNGALSSVADYNSGQITVTLMKGATGIDRAEFMITLALTSRSTSVVRGRNWRFYVNPDRILFYVHTNTSGTGQTVPCFFGFNDSAQCVVEAPNIGTSTTAAGGVPYPFSVQPLTATPTSQRFGRIRIGTEFFPTVLLAGPCQTAAGNGSLVAPANPGLFLLYPPMVIHAGNSEYLGGFGDGISYIDRHYSTMPGFSVFTDAAGNTYHSIYYTFATGVADPYSSNAFKRLLAVKVSP